MSNLIDQLSTVPSEIVGGPVGAVGGGLWQRGGKRGQSGQSKARKRAKAAKAAGVMIEDGKYLDTKGRARELTVQQKAFVFHYTSGVDCAGNGSEAARRAGYSHASAGTIATILTRTPHIIAAIEEEARGAIGSRLCVKSVALLEWIVDSPDVSLKLRAQVAMKAVEFSGIIERMKTEKANNTNGKSLSEMTRDELMETVAKAKAVMSAPIPGPVIEGELVDSAQVSAQVESE